MALQDAERAPSQGAQKRSMISEDVSRISPTGSPRSKASGTGSEGGGAEAAGDVVARSPKFGRQVMSPSEGTIRRESAAAAASSEGGMMFRQLTEVRMSQDALSEMKKMIEENMKRQDTRQIADRIQELYEWVTGLKQSAGSAMMELHTNSEVFKTEVESFLKTFAGQVEARIVELQSWRALEEERKVLMCFELRMFSCVKRLLS